MSENYVGRYAPELFDEGKKYYLLQAQQQTNLTDADLRDLHEISGTNLRRFIQGQIGDCAIGDGFKIAENPSDNTNNFRITGGTGIENPGTFYLKGFRLFLTGNISYNDQANYGDTTGAHMAVDGYTMTALPSLSTPVGTTATINTVEISGQNTVMGDATGNLLYSGDFGKSWTVPTTATQSIESIGFGDDSTGYATGPVGTLYKTTNGGISWTNIHGNLPGAYLGTDFSGASFLNPSSGWLVGESGTILATTNGGATWSSQVSGTSADLHAISVFDSSDVWAVGDVGTVLFYNGGSWTAQASGLTSYNLRNVQSVDGSIVFAIGDHGTVIRTPDGGTTWTIKSYDSTTNLNGLYFTDDRGWVVGNNGIVSHTFDGGNNWDTTVFAPGINLRSVAFQDSTGFVVGDGGTVFRTINDGTTWETYRTDYVYIDFHLAEVSADATSGSEYIDIGLQDSTVGFPRQNRLRIVSDVKVSEGGLPPSDYTVGSIQHYTTPLARIQRPAGRAQIYDSDITDLRMVVRTISEIDGLFSSGGIDSSALAPGSVTPDKLDSSAEYTVGALNVTNDVSIGGNLSVTGSVSIPGNTVLENLTVTGSSILGDSSDSTVQITGRVFQENNYPGSSYVLQAGAATGTYPVFDISSDGTGIVLGITRTSDSTLAMIDMTSYGSGYDISIAHLGTRGGVLNILDDASNSTIVINKNAPGNVGSVLDITTNSSDPVIDITNNAPGSNSISVTQNHGRIVDLFSPYDATGVAITTTTGGIDVDIHHSGLSGTALAITSNSRKPTVDVTSTSGPTMSLEQQANETALLVSKDGTGRGQGVEIYNRGYDVGLGVYNEGTGLGELISHVGDSTNPALDIYVANNERGSVLRINKAADTTGPVVDVWNQGYGASLVINHTALASDSSLTPMVSLHNGNLHPGLDMSSDHWFIDNSGNFSGKGFHFDSTHFIEASSIWLDSAAMDASNPGIRGQAFVESGFLRISDGTTILPAGIGSTGIQGATGFGVAGTPGVTGISGGGTGLGGPTGVQGLTGVGPQGPIGSQGQTGLCGATGIQGVTGMTGEGVTGFYGLTGLQGIQGDQGSTGFYGQTGIQGVTGIFGQTGVQGETGIQGNTGIQGITGVRGDTGIQGITGIYGETGIQGITGFYGQTGVQGVTGFHGQTGIQGDTGVQGVTGFYGQTGIQGVTGFYGHTGLQGVTGIYGETGIQGVTGFYGRTGIQGVTGFHGETGIQGNTGVQGVTGFYGQTGIQGVTGFHGQTGIQGTTGFYGHTGIQGVTGFQGHTGVQGVTGFYGQTGIQGGTGIQGQTGVLGQTGIQGVTGFYGHTGIQGFTGIFGQTGVQGVTGFYGQTGIQGNTGINTVTAAFQLGTDVWLSADQSTTQWGKNPSYNPWDYLASAGGAVHINNSLVNWNISSINVGSGLASASIVVYCDATATDTSSINIYRITRAWDNTNSTWLTYDGTNAWTTPGGDYDSTLIGSFVYSTGQITIPVTPAGINVIQSMINGYLPNYGFVFVGSTSNMTERFRGFRNADASNRPQLVLEYAPAGAQGLTGFYGQTGIQGVTGYYGQTGVQGRTGVQGVTGFYGQTGIQGVTGFYGQTGIQGVTGIYGQTGVQGRTGVQGGTGVQGLTGFYGQTGIQGRTGVQGGTGIQGYTGLSVYTGTLTARNLPFAIGTNQLANSIVDQTSTSNITVRGDAIIYGSLTASSETVTLSGGSQGGGSTFDSTLTLAGSAGDSMKSFNGFTFYDKHGATSGSFDNVATFKYPSGGSPTLQMYNSGSARGIVQFDSSDMVYSSANNVLNMVGGSSVRLSAGNNSATIEVDSTSSTLNDIIITSGGGGANAVLHMSGGSPNYVSLTEGSGLLYMIGGSVGIGTTNPTRQFTVGSTAANGLIAVNGQISPAWSANQKTAFGTIKDGECAQMSPASSNLGGAQIVGFSKNIATASWPNVVLTAYDESDFSSFGSIKLIAEKHNGSGGLIGHGATAKILTLNNDTTNLMTVLGGGNVGFGTTNPGATVDVQATTASVLVKSTTGTNYSYSSMRNGGASLIVGVESSTGSSLLTGASPYAMIFGSESDSSSPIQFGIHNSLIMTMLNGGNVGIGTTNPGTIVEIRGNYTANKGQLFVNALPSQNGYVVINADATRECGILLDTTGVIQWYIYRPSSANDLRFYAGGADRVTFQQGGNVGIDTTSPVTTLGVNGSLSIAGMATCTTDYTVASTDYTIICTPGSGNNTTMLLPNPVTCKGRLLHIIMATASQNVYNNETTGLPHIRYPGGLNYYYIIDASKPENWSELQSDGTYWWLIATGQY